jgi:hypothetical protein
VITGKIEIPQHESDPSKLNRNNGARIEVSVTQIKIQAAKIEILRTNDIASRRQLTQACPHRSSCCPMEIFRDRN